MHIAYVKAHVGVAINERADILADSGRQLQLSQSPPEKPEHDFDSAKSVCERHLRWKLHSPGGYSGVRGATSRLKTCRISEACPQLRRRPDEVFKRGRPEKSASYHQPTGPAELRVRRRASGWRVLQRVSVSCILRRLDCTMNVEHTSLNIVHTSGVCAGCEVCGRPPSVGNRCAWCPAAAYQRNLYSENALNELVELCHALCALDVMRASTQ